MDDECVQEGEVRRRRDGNGLVLAGAIRCAGTDDAVEEIDCASV